MRPLPVPFPSAWRLLAVVLVLAGLDAARAAVPDFNRDVRPILAENCFNCHGFDDKTRKAGLRLDLGEDAYRGGKSGKPAVVPGRPEESALFARVVTGDPDDLMPPPEHGSRLTAVQVDVLRRWLEAGGEYKPHWAFLPPERPPLPEVPDPAWPRNGIDHFVAARLADEGLRPQPEAGKETLIRRVTLDLTGLPPTTDEIDAYLSDASPDAYERVVDRLLSSARYGERMALEWLDAARYADTHGYHIDSARDMTPWRDWVISAFNRNQPFDAFTVEQIAGDLLPEPTREQRLATGFNRNHMINYEGGAIPEEYHTAYIVDRINTTSTVWLGLTMACAQCHDHKYDPFTMRDFYGMYAIFNNVPENGLDGRNGNAVPLVKLPSSSDEAERVRLAGAVAEAEAALANPPPAVDAAQRAWEQHVAAAGAPAAWSAVTVDSIEGENGTRFTRMEDGSWLAVGTPPASETYVVRLRVPDLPRVTALRVEALPDDSLPKKGPGRYENGNLVLTDARITAGDRPLAIASASADHSQKDYPVTHVIDDRPETGWAILPETGRSHHVVLALAEPVVAGEAPGITLRLVFGSAFPAHQIGRVRVRATASDHPHGTSDVPEDIRSIAALAPGDRSADQVQRLRDHYRDKVSPEMRGLREAVAARRRERDAFEQGIRTSMVMAEMERPRETFMLVRGQYDKKGDKVGPALPAALAPKRGEGPSDRLALARWLVSPEQPLTARVIVNRYWQMYFGDGLVKSAENFGTQGDWPSHPALLDWLATEFMRTGWDVKRMQKLIVMSATYRQSSRAPRELYERDPENRLLGRGPRVRLAAEFLRDLALSTADLLDPRIGGASVFPYQPAGLWEELMSREDNDRFTAQKYVQSHGADLYRRSMYTFIKRTSPHPELTTFDAPDRQVCTVRRPRTNTPLQALALMNDVTYVESARRLAEIAMRSGSDAAERITFAFRRATGRRPAPAETAVLTGLYREQHAVFAADRAAAERLVSEGESPVDPALDPVDLAAWTVVMNAILNLDETVTKG